MVQAADPTTIPPNGPIPDDTWIQYGQLYLTSDHIYHIKENKEQYGKFVNKTDFDDHSEYEVGGFDRSRTGLFYKGGHKQRLLGDCTPPDGFVSLNWLKANCGDSELTEGQANDPFVNINGPIKLKIENGEIKSIVEPYTKYSTVDGTKIRIYDKSPVFLPSVLIVLLIVVILL